MDCNGVKTNYEAEWQQVSVPPDISQIIGQHHVEIRKEFNDGAVYIVDSLKTHHQQCFQITSDNLEYVVRKTIQECLGNSRNETQASDQQLLPPEAIPVRPGSPVLQEAPGSDSRWQIGQLTLELENAHSELKKLRSELKATELRANKLRDIIVPNEDEIILDSDVQTLFSEVRKLVQLVVSRLYTKTVDYRNSTTEDSRAFFRKVDGLSHQRQQEAIRAELFLFFQEKFFSEGFGDFGLGKEHRDLEDSLIDAESALTAAFGTNPSNDAFEQAMVEWKRATFKCVHLLKDSDGGPNPYLRYVEGLFRPAEADDPKALQRGKDRLRLLCEKAYDLGVLMRRARDTFQVFAVTPRTPLVDCGDIVEEIWYNGEGTSGRLKEVDFCLFGGLRKISRDYPSQPILLEKAHVSTRMRMSS